jgi:6-phosphofructokinase 1
VREGFEGLVRGNTRRLERLETEEMPESEGILMRNLHFGLGDIIKDGMGDHSLGESLRGQYIIRIGWDDVQGWLAEVRFLHVIPVYDDG